MKSFEELETWKEAGAFRINLSKLVRTFPESEKHRLIDQIIRASRSVTANIAEGFGRFHFQENIQFCRTARGSLFEIKDHLICSLDENYITKANYLGLEEQFAYCLKLLNGYIAFLKKQKLNNK